MSIMDRLTRRARRALSLAHQKAERMRHSYIGTEHLLLGLIREEGGVGGRVLRELGLDPMRVQERVERITGIGQYRGGKIDLSPGTQQVLEYAVDEAKSMGHHYIGTEHLLLGLIRNDEGVGLKVLQQEGVTPEQIRRQTKRVLQASSTPRLTTSSSSLSESPAQMFRTKDRLTKQARNALSLAQQRAEKMRQSSIGTEHLLLGLILDREGVAGRILRELVRDPSQGIERVEKVGGPGTLAGEEIDLSPMSEQVLRDAMDEAKKMEYPYIGTEHLLIALIRNSEGNQYFWEFVGR